MALRSRYREKPTEALNNFPEVKLNGAEPVTVTGIGVEAPPEAVTLAMAHTLPG